MKEFNKKLFCTVERVKHTIGVDDKAFLEMLGVTPKSYLRIKAGLKSFSLDSLQSLCNSLELSETLLFNGKVDYGALAKYYRGEHPALPERYLVPNQQLARIRSIQGIFLHADTLRGYDYSYSIAKRLQIHPIQHFSHGDFVSPLVTMDLLRELREDGFSNEDIRAMGTMTLAINRKTELGKIFSYSRSPSELYESMHLEHIDRFDHIWNYKLIRLNKRGCSVAITPRAQSIEAFEARVLGNREICIFRQGVYASLLGNIRNSYARVLETECAYRGDSRCVYHLSWEHAVKAA